MSEKTEAELTSEGVDQHHWGPTEDDEEAVLRELYGEPGPDGIYRGEGL
ncbi:hypothetical protein AB0F17_15975 [Nonomuraea sp. NPDC026600]